MRRVSLHLQKDLLNLQGASKRLKSVRMTRWCAGTSRVDGCCLVRQGENAEQFLKPSYNAETGNKNEKKGKKPVRSHQAESGGGVEQKKNLNNHAYKETERTSEPVDTEENCEMLTFEQGMAAARTNSQSLWLPVHSQTSKHSRMNGRGAPDAPPLSEN